MNATTHWAGWTLLLAIGFGASPPNLEKPLPEAPPQSLRVGMNRDEVRILLGPPRKVARQVLYQRCREQWHYDLPTVSWVEFECRRGHAPQLQTVHPPQAANR